MKSRKRICCGLVYLTSFGLQSTKFPIIYIRAQKCGLRFVSLSKRLKQTVWRKVSQHPLKVKTNSEPTESIVRNWNWRFSTFRSHVSKSILNTDPYRTIKCESFVLQQFSVRLVMRFPILFPDPIRKPYLNTTKPYLCSIDGQLSVRWHGLRWILFWLSFFELLLKLTLLFRTLIISGPADIFLPPSVMIRASDKFFDKRFQVNTFRIQFIVPQTKLFNDVNNNKIYFFISTNLCEDMEQSVGHVGGIATPSQ